MRRTTIQYLTFAFLTCTVLAYGQQVQKRTPFPIPLAKLSPSFSQYSSKLISIRVGFEGDNDFAEITPLNDTNVHVTNKGRQRMVYQESPDLAYLTTTYENETLRKVVKSLIATINIMERDLKDGRFDRCLYLDSYFPRFLRGFYFLIDAIRNGSETLPKYGKIPESEFDVSQASVKSDLRINLWRVQSDHILKLRIICKELSFQLKEWDENYLGSAKRNPEVLLDTKMKEAYGLFIRLYFNIKPTPDVPVDGVHL